MISGIDLNISAWCFLLLAIAGCNQATHRNKEKIDGVYHQGQVPSMSPFIYYNDGDFIFSQRRDSSNVFKIHNNLGVLKFGDTIIYKKVYDDTYVVPVYDSLIIANRDYCSHGSCFIYDLTLYKTNIVRARIYYPYQLKGNYEFKVIEPFANWLNRSCNSLNTYESINVFGNLKDIKEGRKMISLLSCLFYKNNTMNYFFGDIIKMPLEIQLMEGVVQQILKIHINDASKNDSVFINPSARDSVGGRDLAEE